MESDEALDFINVLGISIKIVMEIYGKIILFQTKKI